MLSKFLHGAILGLIVVAVNYFTSSQKKMTKTKRFLISAIICAITGLFYLAMPD